MNKDKIFSIIRIVFAIAGSILVGKNIGGTVIDQNWMMLALGVALGLAGLIWSFYDQTSTLESFQASIMQAFLFAGGILVSSGVLSVEKVETWAGIVAMIGSLVYPILSREKSKNIAEGKIPIEALKGVNEEGAPQKAITPVLEMIPPKEDNKP